MTHTSEQDRIDSLRRQLDALLAEKDRLALMHDGAIPGGDHLHSEIIRLSGEIRRREALQAARLVAAE